MAILDEVARQGINQLLGMIPDTQFNMVMTGFSTIGPIMTRIGEIGADQQVDDEEFQAILDELDTEQLKLLYGTIRKMLGL